MDRFKSVMLSILKFVRIVLPIICVVIYGLSWIVYLVNGNIHGHSFDGAPKAFWTTIELISDVVFINAIVFVTSFSCFMLIKPLHGKYKVLRVFLRLIIDILVCAVFLFFSYLALGTFVGFGG